MHNNDLTSIQDVIPASASSSNQLAVSSSVPKGGYFDANVTTGTNTITSANVISGTFPTDTRKCVYSTGTGWTSNDPEAKAIGGSSSNSVIIKSTYTQRLRTIWIQY